MESLRTRLPGLVLALMGIFILVGGFFESGPMASLSSYAVEIALVLLAVLLLLVVAEVLMERVRGLAGRRADWPYDAALLLGALLMVAGATMTGTSSGAAWIYHFAWRPLMSTFAALFGFFMVAATMRAFRVRTLESTVFVASASLVVLLRSPFWGAGQDTATALAEWLLSVPHMATLRAVWIGGCLALLLLGARALFGPRRPEVTKE